mmetsp:Transcript_42926/g.109814  ORF Transcript_42926/g.109814 Transcript_42926/m.109814 type:complete len:485 (-) Transcript_42926:2629-4083(-)
MTLPAHERVRHGVQCCCELLHLGKLQHVLQLLRLLCCLGAKVGAGHVEGEAHLLRKHRCQTLQGALQSIHHARPGAPKGAQQLWDPWQKHRGRHPGAAVRPRLHQPLACARTWRRIVGMPVQQPQQPRNVQRGALPLGATQRHGGEKVPDRTGCQIVGMRLGGGGRIAPAGQEAVAEERQLQGGGGQARAAGAAGADLSRLRGRHISGLQVRAPGFALPLCLAPRASPACNVVAPLESEHRQLGDQHRAGAAAARSQVRYAVAQLLQVVVLSPPCGARHAELCALPQHKRALCATLRAREPAVQQLARAVQMAALPQLGHTLEQQSALSAPGALSLAGRKTAKRRKQQAARVDGEHHAVSVGMDCGWGAPRPLVGQRVQAPAHARLVGACSVLEKLQSLLHLCVRLQVQQQPVPAVGVGGAGLGPLAREDAVAGGDAVFCDVCSLPLPCAACQRERGFLGSLAQQGRLPSRKRLGILIQPATLE